MKFQRKHERHNFRKTTTKPVILIMNITEWHLNASYKNPSTRTTTMVNGDDDDNKPKCKREKYSNVPSQSRKSIPMLFSFIICSLDCRIHGACMHLNGLLLSMFLLFSSCRMKYSTHTHTHTHTEKFKYFCYLSFSIQWRTIHDKNGTFLTN